MGRECFCKEKGREGRMKKGSQASSCCPQGGWERKMYGRAGARVDGRGADEGVRVERKWEPGKTPRELRGRSGRKSGFTGRGVGGLGGVGSGRELGWKGLVENLPAK